MSSLSAVPPPDPPPDGEQSPQMRLPGFQGLTVNKLFISFGGTMEVTEQDLADKLLLNRDVELVVAGRLMRSAHAVKLDGDGYLEETTNRVALRIESLAMVGGDDDPEPEKEANGE